MEILIREVIQAGDNFLFHWDCPNCFHANLTGYPIGYCDGCSKNFSKLPIMRNPNRSGFRLLAGTKRKTRIGIKVVRRLLAISGGCCSYCSESVKETYQIDHIMPVSLGGTNEISNLCVSCRKCNSIAGARAFNSFTDKRVYILDRRF